MNGSFFPKYPNPKTHSVFLLSPANMSGERAKLLLSARAEFDLAVRLRNGRATLGEAFAFISGLYFRGKLAYANTFAAPPPGIPPALVITTSHGLVLPETLVTPAKLKRFAAVPIDVSESRYLRPLVRDCRALADSVSENCVFVLLGSIATPKYLEPMSVAFGERLHFPDEFLGRGDLSRGGLMLRCVKEDRPMNYSSISTLAQH